LGLCDEKAVEGIRMMKRQAAGVQRMAVLRTRCHAIRQVGFKEA
jgi:hypothetical protein